MVGGAENQESVGRMSTRQEEIPSFQGNSHVNFPFCKKHAVIGQLADCSRREVRIALLCRGIIHTDVKTHV